MISAIKQLWYYALAYVIGGVTFIPLCLLLFLIFATSPRKKCTLTTQAEPQSDDESALHTDEEFKVGELEELKGVETFKRGWLYVTNKYYYHSSELVGAAGQDKDSLPTRDKLKRKKRFYAVLKHGNLFLYKTDAESTDVSQVIVLKNSFVTIWPRDTSMELLDASLFTNKTCISICKNGKAYVGENGRLKFAESSPVGVLDQYFIYLENNVEKEDWYFALINASKITQTDSILDPTNSATTAHLRTKDMMSLLQTVNATEGQFATKWLNALVNRLFLSLQQTETLHGILKEKIHKKLTKINKPGFLDDFKIEHVDVGTSAPIITNPKLLELSPEGSTRVRFNMQYRGNLSLIVSTKVNINLGSRFKSREVTIELAITVKEVDGPIIVLVKPPPSNRLWYAFESDPVLNIDIEPIVSTRQFSYNMITNVIKSKFKEAIHESIVLPYMDDIVFYSTQDEVYRGGIWLHETKKRQEKNDVPEQTEDDVVTTPYNGNLYKSETTLFAAPTESKAPAATQPAERKDSVISPSASYEDDVATLSLRKPTDSIHSSDSDSASERGSIISLGESSLKTKTMHRVGTLKNMIKARASNDGSIRSLDSNSPVDTSGSKKYFQSGMKKIGRWYRDQVNNAKDAVHDSQIDGMHRFDTSVFVQEAPKQGGPEMISNRRSNPRLKSQSDIKDDFLKLPSESSADMFVNRARATSFDSPKSPNIPNAYPFVPQSPIGSVSPDSVPSRRLSINSQVEQASSSELTQMEEFSRKMDESLTNVPEKEESTRITKEMDIFSPSASYPLTTVDTIDPLDTAAELSTKLKEDTGIAFDLISEQVQESKSAIDKPARNESVASAVEIAARVCPPELPPRPQT